MAGRSRPMQRESASNPASIATDLSITPLPRSQTLRAENGIIPSGTPSQGIQHDPMTSNNFEENLDRILAFLTEINVQGFLYCLLVQEYALSIPQSQERLAMTKKVIEHQKKVLGIEFLQMALDAPSRIGGLREVFSLTDTGEFQVKA